MSWCADCGQPLKPIHGTATVVCCSGLRYWLETPPLPRDNIVACATVVVKGRKFWRYEWRPQTS